MAGYHWLCGPLELEVDEGLDVGGDELVDEEDCDDYDDSQHPQGHLCKPKAIASFEALGEPVDDHSDEEGEEYAGLVGDNEWYVGEVPRGTYAVDHVFGCIPCHFVGFGG